MCKVEALCDCCLKTDQSSSDIWLKNKASVFLINWRLLNIQLFIHQWLVNCWKLPTCIIRFGRGFVFNNYSSESVKPNSYSFQSWQNTNITNKLLLNRLSSSEATGVIPSRYVRDYASPVANPLVRVINLSIIQGVIPEDFCLARVVPLF